MSNLDGLTASGFCAEEGTPSRGTPLRFASLRSGPAHPIVSCCVPACAGTCIHRPVSPSSFWAIFAGGGATFNAGPHQQSFASLPKPATVGMPSPGGRRVPSPCGGLSQAYNARQPASRFGIRHKGRASSKLGPSLYAKRHGFGRGVHFFCDSVGIRTRDPQLRRLLLYPAELRNLKGAQR